MSQHTAKQTPPYEQYGVNDWTARFWLPAPGNPFLPLVDPTYTGRMLKDRTASLAQLAIPLTHALADPRDTTDEDTDIRN